jgi:HK97 family phage major capsid protein
MLRYLADKKIEDQMISGSGTGQLSGILTSGNYTAYTRAVTGDDNYQTVRRGITQLQKVDFNPDALIVSPATWEKLELLEDGSQRPLLIGTNQGAGVSRVEAMFGIPVVVSNAMSDSYMLLGAFRDSCHLVDRNQTQVRIAYEHSSNFAKHMVSMRASHRLAFAVVAPAAIVRLPVA